ncbi:sensor histidine kinase [Arthrobacter caoxuetaonis]|uniref:sensor histidine kinase n=1 Tax=Arthrobacter caoxuetaonis TaxID=2886935 RepID=UPI001D1482EB|nr:histidine kinase [Arthrobacter caoxuetaonis]MCC3281411.1 histidine kinase [Arthrobacter caoxuetaonis]
MPQRLEHPSALKTAGLTFGAAVTGLLVFLVVQGSMLPPDGADPAPFIGLMFLDFMLGVAAFGLLPLALRRFPVGAGLGIIALSSLSTLAFVPACMALIGIAALRHPRALAAAVLVYAAAVAVDLTVRPVEDMAWWALSLTALAMLLVLVLIGLNRGARRALIASLRHEADSARREQDALAAQARLAERTRIAREMHDTLSHRLSLIAMHAGALEYRADLDRETIRSTAAVLRETAHTAAGELRTVLSVLREEAAETSPQPTVHSIPALVETARAAGSDVTLHMDPPLRGDEAASLPDATSRHLYRVVQEGLTNAQKHAPGLPVTVSLTGGPGRGITVSASNPVSGQVTAAPGGLGLVGLAERARLADGTFESGLRHGMYTTTVKVPW